MDLFLALQVRCSSWHFLRLHCRKSWISDHLLYYYRTVARTVSRKELWLEYLGRNGSHTDWTVSAVHEWFFYFRISRSALAALCTRFFLTYPLCRSFFSNGRWNQTFLHAVSGSWYCFPDSGIFRGSAAFLCKSSGNAGTICCTDCSDCTSVYRSSFLCRWLYPAGSWSERTKSDHCFSADESGIGFSVLGGWVLLHEHLSGRELFGCLLIFVAVVWHRFRYSQFTNAVQIN